MKSLKCGSREKQNQTTKVPVQFKLIAPRAKEVCVAGDFTRWGAAVRRLKRKSGGTWETRVLLKPGRHQYKFLVDGKWQIDPDCEEYVANQCGTMNNVVEAK